MFEYPREAHQKATGLRQAALPASKALFSPGATSSWFLGGEIYAVVIDGAWHPLAPLRSGGSGMRMKTRAGGVVAMLVLSAGLVAAPAAATAPTTGDGIVDLEGMVVSGAQPGPGMWTVRHGDHVLRVLGTVSPLPRRMEWMSAEVEAAVAASRVVIAPPAVVVDADVGIFRGMALLPAMLRARNNPGKRSLREVVSPELYARWEVLKARYIGRDRGVEKRRPLLAALALYEAALERSGLRPGGVVGPVVRKARRAAGVPLVETTVRLQVEDPKRVLRELGDSELADRECFAGMLDRIEGDLDTLRARANAWAVGDIEGLRALPYDDHDATCREAVTGSVLAKELGIDDLSRRARDAWLANVDQALVEHPASFTMLPMDQLLGEDGMLEALAARGYVVEAP